MKLAALGSLICCCVAFPSVATEATPLLFKNNEQLQVYLSNNNPNKIIVDNDKIIEDKGISSQYTINATSDGGVTIIPLEQKDPITVFFNTKYGRSLSVSIKSDKGPGKTYTLLPEDDPVFSEKEDAKDWEQSQPYEETIKFLISSVKKGDIPPEYEEFKLSKRHITPEYQPYPPVELKRERIWVGGFLTVVQYSMENTSNLPVSLQERYFYMNGTRAVSISTPRLASHETGRVWIVSETSKSFKVNK